MGRARKIDAVPHAELAGGFSATPARSALDDCPDPAARAILADGELLAFAPRWFSDLGGVVMSARWTGTAFKVFDGFGDCRGVFASWSAANTALTALAAE